MRVHRDKKLKKFVESIDCKFPYDNAAAAKELIDEALAFKDPSGEPVFAVVHEMLRPPKGTHVAYNREDLLGYIGERFDHPLKQTVFKLARSILTGGQAAPSDVVIALKEIATHPHEYSALDIAYFSGWDEAVEALYEKIRARW